MVEAGQLTQPLFIGKKLGRQKESFFFLAPLFRSGCYSTLQRVHVGGREGFSTHAPVSLLDFFNEHER